jgi:uncharacterized protein (DUF2342 family)
MCTKEDTRQLQLERANLIEHLSKARALLANASTHMLIDNLQDASPSRLADRERIEAYLKIGMFDELPQEIAR